MDGGPSRVDLVPPGREWRASSEGGHDKDDHESYDKGHAGPEGVDKVLWEYALGETLVEEQDRDADETDGDDILDFDGERDLCGRCQFRLSTIKVIESFLVAIQSRDVPS